MADEKKKESPSEFKNAFDVKGLAPKAAVAPTPEANPVDKPQKSESK